MDKTIDNSEYFRISENTYNKLRADSDKLKAIGEVANDLDTDTMAAIDRYYKIKRILEGK